MSSNSNWKRELADLLKAYNGLHARMHKPASYRTRELRGDGLFLCIATLRQLRFQVGPRSLKQKHIRALMDFWTANPDYADHCQACGLELKRRSPSFIQQHLSFLRVLQTWVGKPKMIGPARSYVSDPALVERHYAATEPHGWEDRGIDVDAMLAKVSAHDRHVGMQLELMLAFGLRRKEAVMFTPADAVVPAHGLPVEHANDQYRQFIRVKRGTKGGRLRFVAVRTEFQIRTLERARELAGDGHMGTPGLSLEQSLNRFSNTMKAMGITRRMLDVTAHGTRHQFASDLYVDIAQVPPPVAGGTIDDEARKKAYLEVARQLGHNRAGISSAYLGSPHRPQPPQE